MLTTNRKPALLALIGAAALLTATQPAEAGPPLICHRFETGGAPSLPWGDDRDHWAAPSPSYNVSRLTVDTIGLLAPDTPIKARMETMRRATIYAARDAKAANALLTAILARALDTDASGKVSADALFDAGYLVESYRQASHVYRWNMLDAAARGTWVLQDEPRGLNGVAWVERARALAGTNAGEMRFAATLMKDGAPQSARTNVDRR